MNFKNGIQKKNKWLLPFSWLYAAGVGIFNKLYDSGLKKTTNFPIPIICVGNLSVGGTGKSPMVEYLIRLLQIDYKIATISRGYRRRTKGFILATDQSSAREIGDEPMQFYSKFPGITVAVGEDRVAAARQLLREKPALDVLILDDAFQHRAIEAGFNILLTDYNNLFTTDYYLPAGQLRDLKLNSKRAQCIVVTKCPQNITVAEGRRIDKELKQYATVPVFFTTLEYDTPYHIFNGQRLTLDTVETILLVTGIANPGPLIRELKEFKVLVKEFIFPDHHDFTETEINHVLSLYNQYSAQNTVIITTEKDGVKLREFKELLNGKNIYAMPVSHLFLLDDKEKFNILINDYLKKAEKQ